MLQKLATIAIFLSASAAAQNSSTDCTRDSLGNMHCTTSSQPGITIPPPLDYGKMIKEGAQTVQQPTQTQQDLSAIAAANAAYMERKREQKIVRAAKAAMDSDTATAEAAPTDEPPVLLSCNVDGKFAGTLALYERHSRVDATTDDGITKSRKAVFTPTAVSWISPVWRSSVSRLDGSYIGTGNIPELQGQKISGTCSVVPERKF